MKHDYSDRYGCAMSQQEVHALPAEVLAERSAAPLHILPDREALYEAIAEVMVKTIEAKQRAKVTMILPVGPVGQYPAFARKVRQRNVDCRNLWTFNMDEFLDRNGRTIPETHPMSFRAEMMRKFYHQLPAAQRMPLEQMFFPSHDRMEAMDRALDEHASNGVDLCLAGVGPQGHFAFNEDPNFRHVEVSQQDFLADRTPDRCFPQSLSRIVEEVSHVCSDGSSVFWPSCSAAWLHADESRGGHCRRWHSDRARAPGRAGRSIRRGFGQAWSFEPVRTGCNAGEGDRLHVARKQEGGMHPQR